jgi:ubiquitin-like protein Pup
LRAAILSEGRRRVDLNQDEEIPMAGTESSGGGQKRATRRNDEVEEVETTTDAQSDVAERQNKLSDDVDAILDEIDDVLEENAEEFIRGYIQKGGE